MNGALSRAAFPGMVVAVPEKFASIPRTRLNIADRGAQRQEQ
jgi:hypothetical protein